MPLWFWMPLSWHFCNVIMTGRWFTVTGVHSIPAMPSTKGWNKKGFARACPAQAVWTMPLWRAYGAYSKTEMYYLRHFKGYHELCEAVAAYINFYTNERYQKKLGCITPAEFLHSRDK